MLCTLGEPTTVRTPLQRALRIRESTRLGLLALPPLPRTGRDRSLAGSRTATSPPAPTTVGDATFTAGSLRVMTGNMKRTTEEE